MGLIERERGNYDAAEAAFEHSIDVYTRRYGEGHPRTLDPMGNLAEVLAVYKDKTARAETLLERVIASRRALHEESSLKLATNLDMLSQVRLDQGRHEEAAALAQEADAGYSGALGAEHNYRAFALIHLGHARLGMHDGAGAIEAFREALRLRRRAFGAEHPDVANSLHNLGEAYLKLGDLPAAESALREALAIRVRVLSAEHVLIPRTRLSLIETLAGLHRIDEATAELAKAESELDRSTEDVVQDRKRVAELEALLAHS
jgi:serine/threonine-protein kinase